MQVRDIYKCKTCGVIVEVLHAGAEGLSCCNNEKMQLLTAQTADKTLEKHVPVIEKTEKGFTVKVGTVPHPMEEKHYIEWIQLIVGGRAYREFLRPGMEPKATFCIADVDIKDVSAREYCNVHGLWRS